MLNLSRFLYVNLLAKQRINSPDLGLMNEAPSSKPNSKPDVRLVSVDVRQVHSKLD